MTQNNQANKSMADGVRIASQIEDLFDHYDQLKTTDIHEHIKTDVSLQTLRSILAQLNEQDRLKRIDANGNESETGQYWTQPVEETTLRNVVEWTRDIGLLDKPIDDDSLTPVEILAHIINTADWIDVQNNQQDTALTQNHFALRQQLQTLLETHNE